MKVNKKQLKSIIKEELSKVINEFEDEEFSLDDFEAAEREVGQSDKTAVSLQNGKELYALLNKFARYMNDAGGTGAVDKADAEMLPYSKLYNPYDRNLAIIYKVLKQMSERMFGVNSGYDWARDHTLPLKWELQPAAERLKRFQANPNKDSNNALNSLRKQSQGSISNVLETLDEIIDFARKTADHPALNFEEPYLSRKNAEQLEQLVQNARNAQPGEGSLSRYY